MLDMHESLRSQGKLGVQEVAARCQSNECVSPFSIFTLTFVILESNATPIKSSLTYHVPTLW